MAYVKLKSRWRSIRLPACVGREFQRKWTWCNILAHKNTILHVCSVAWTYIFGCINARQSTDGELCHFMVFSTSPIASVEMSVKHMCQITKHIWLHCPDISL